MEFIKRNNTPVPENVIEHVEQYLKEKELGELVKVVRMSDHPEDCYLYMVIAHKINETWGDTYSCWTMWNEFTQCLNYGHYHLTLDQCEQILKERFHRIEGINVID